MLKIHNLVSCWVVAWKCSDALIADISKKLQEPKEINKHRDRDFMHKKMYKNKVKIIFLSCASALGQASS